MHTKRTIALIGTGTSSKVLATALAKRNNRLLVFSRYFEEAENTVAGIKEQFAFSDIEAMPCSFTASWEADIIITAIPNAELKELEDYIKEVAVQKIFIITEIKKEPDAVFDTVNEAKKVLPFTHIVHASLSINKYNESGCELSGDDSEAINMAHELFKEAGIHLIEHINNNK